MLKVGTKVRLIRSKRHDSYGLPSKYFGGPVFSIFDIPSHRNDTYYIEGGGVRFAIKWDMAVPVVEFNSRRPHVHCYKGSCNFKFNVPRAAGPREVATQSLAAIGEKPSRILKSSTPNFVRGWASGEPFYIMRVL